MNGRPLDRYVCVWVSVPIGVIADWTFDIVQMSSCGQLHESCESFEKSIRNWFSVPLCVHVHRFWHFRHLEISSIELNHATWWTDQACGTNYIYFCISKCETKEEEKMEFKLNWKIDWHVNVTNVMWSRSRQKNHSPLTMTQFSFVQIRLKWEASDPIRIRISIENKSNGNYTAVRSFH